MGFNSGFKGLIYCFVPVQLLIVLSLKGAVITESGQRGRLFCLIFLLLDLCYNVGTFT